MGAGIVMIAAGIIGMLGSMVLLCVLPAIFEKQRKKLLSEIEKNFRRFYKKEGMVCIAKNVDKKMQMKRSFVVDAGQN